MKRGRLDTNFIVARRLQLGYSQRDMENETGLSGPTIAAVETARNHEKMTLAMLERIADALQVPAERLLAERHREPQASGAATAHLSNDARRLGELLLSLDKAIPRAAASRVLGLDIKRIHETVDELIRYTSVPDSLLKITTSNGRVGLVPRDDAVTPDELVALHHAVMAVDGLRHPAARMLSAVAHGEIKSDREQQIRHADLPHLQSLLKQRLIERTADGQLHLAGDVAFSLGLTDARSAGLRRKSVPLAPTGPTST